MLEMIFALEANSQTCRHRRCSASESRNRNQLVLQSGFTSISVQDVAAPCGSRDTVDVELETGFFLDLPTSGREEGFSLFYPATRQFPGAAERPVAEIPGVKQQNRSVCVDQHQPHCIALDVGLLVHDMNEYAMPSRGANPTAPSEGGSIRLKKRASSGFAFVLSVADQE